VRYSGSLLKYSFSEADHRKGVLCVELDAQGQASIESYTLTPRRDVRIIEGAFADLLRGPPPGTSADDYLLLRLTDTGTIHDPMARLQQVYPHALQLERPALHRVEGTGAASSAHRTMSERDLFSEFFAHATGAPLDQVQEAILSDVLDQHRRARREDPA
jgi:exonuclease SbcD